MVRKLSAKTSSSSIDVGQHSVLKVAGYGALLWVLIQLVLPMMGIQQDFYWASIVWVAIGFVIVKIVWTTLESYRLVVKSSTVIVIFGVLATIFYKPMKDTYYLTAKVSFVIFMPSPDLAECESRTFFVRHVGVRELNNAEATLWDTKGNRGTVQRWPVISANDPDGANPKYISWNPSSPWDEEYSFTTAVEKERVEQRLIARSVQGKLARAAEVFVNGKNVFSCRDSLLPPSYSLAKDASQSCNSLDIPAGITTKLEVVPSSAQHPDGSLTVYKVGREPVTSGLEGDFESRHLWEYQKDQMRGFLERDRGTKIRIAVSDTGEETWKFAQDIAGIFRQSQWNVEGPTKLPHDYDGMVDVSVGINPVNEHWTAVDSMMNALINGGVKHHKNFGKDFGVPVNTMVLWVGSHSPHDFNPDSCEAVMTSLAMKPCVASTVAKHVCPFPPQ